MESRYIQNQEIPPFDPSVTETLNRTSFDGGGNPMIIAIENTSRHVYRVVSTVGLSEYLGTIAELLRLGFIDLLALEPTSKEGYDSRLRPISAALPQTEEASEWTDEELEAAVDAYLMMLDRESRGETFNKSAIGRELREGVLKVRTAASIEFRMQNISVILNELCLPYIKGYVPAKNVGKGVKSRIVSMLSAKGVFSEEDYTPASGDVELAEKVAELRKRALVGEPKGIRNPKRVECSVSHFVRDPLVKAWILEKANGICEGCGQAAQFSGNDGQPYLEVHHVLPLASGGSDQISNAVALCPNCHRRCHLSSDRFTYIEGLYTRIERLIREKESIGL